ncbi:MAG: hypothetical protein COB23_09120 [Methylophaga sp.]|nr:MAG: hypothetical protein COB23_09120 [Methylophaga sp.]
MQQINLYQQQFKPKKVIFPAKQMLLLALISVVLLIVFSILLSQKLQHRTVSLDDQTQQIKELSQQQVSLQSQISTRVLNPILVAELKNIQQQQQDNQSLLKHLSNRSFGNRAGFSSILTTLSEHRIDNAWLSQFSLLQGGEFITLYGSALTSELVPQYIDNLATSDYFHGKNFSVFKLEQPEDTTIYNFQLHAYNAEKEVAP